MSTATLPRQTTKTATKSQTQKPTTLTHKLVPQNVKKDDLMAFTYYVKVKNTSVTSNSVVGTNLDDDFADITFTGRNLIENAASADQYAEEVKITQTEMIHILMRSYNRPFTVVFEKKDGSERELRGRLVEPDPCRGYSLVEDLDIDGDADKRLRQVDHRTLSLLIVDGVKYVQK